MSILQYYHATLSNRLSKIPRYIVRFFVLFYRQSSHVIKMQRYKWPPDVYLAFYVRYRSGFFWLKVVPWGMRALLGWIKGRYGNVAVFITENGISDNNGTTHDPFRSEYYRLYINDVLKGKHTLFDNMTDGTWFNH